MSLKNKQVVKFWNSNINPITGWSPTVFVDRNLRGKKERELKLSAVKYVEEVKKGIYFNSDATL